MIRGAEAIVTFEDDAVVKERVAKGYRHARIDAQLIAQRTRSEAKILERLAGVRGVPRLNSVEGHTLRIERVHAEPYAGQSVAEELARVIFAIHERGVIHADITPKNVLVGSEVWLIDYGLADFSERLEDQAYDLTMTKETFSSHPGFSEALISAYRELLDDPNAFDERVERIEARGRHKKK